MVLIRALTGANKETILSESDPNLVRSGAIKAIADGSYRNKTRDEIQGTGYVVRSLEAALWCFWATDSFEEAVLKAVNLGDDADTTAAVCGQVAGAFYGESGIPDRWLQRLTKVQEIRHLARQLHAADGLG